MVSHRLATMMTMTTKDEALTKVASRQRSLVTMDDALAVGMTEDDVEHRLSVGRLIRVRRGVSRIAGTEPCWEQQVLAACLAAGRPAVASHRTAAYLHGFVHVERPDQIELTVPWPLQSRLSGVRVRRVNLL